MTLRVMCRQGALVARSAVRDRCRDVGHGYMRALSRIPINRRTHPIPVHRKGERARVAGGRRDPLPSRTVDTTNPLRDLRRPPG
ncbi:hypothetical protein A8924_2541 [Saccharopolyspora erythraea NRRL 2338]|uniref:Uncharacterized protein n=1 Tax=Saccharopolyspora erythraea TaxID=1836 RepID=A0ABN1CLF4_SACER|nr:hypothetical protein A8924_2541 [Saccharopolyspora erythraea NRRL 2338]